MFARGRPSSKGQCSFYKVSSENHICFYKILRSWSPHSFCCLLLRYLCFVQKHLPYSVKTFDSLLMKWNSYIYQSQVMSLYPSLYWKRFTIIIIRKEYNLNTELNCKLKNWPEHWWYRISFLSPLCTEDAYDLSLSG